MSKRNKKYQNADIATYITSAITFILILAGYPTGTISKNRHKLLIPMLALFCITYILTVVSRFIYSKIIFLLKNTKKKNSGEKK